jgi:signal transduction histidine kinase
MISIQGLLQKNLNRMLIVSLSGSLLVLVLYSFISLKQTESQAIRFVSKHVLTLAQAGVNSQNVNEIDKEVARFASTWKESQDLDLRVDIFLNDKLVSHAGPLQPMQTLFSGTNQIVSLPSGDTLKFNIQVGLANFIISGLMLFGSFGLFIFGVFWILKRSMHTAVTKITSPLEERIEWLTDISKDLPVSAHAPKPEFQTSHVSEIELLTGSIENFLSEITTLESKLTQASFDQGRAKMADQFAHSIKGVIGSLQLRVKNTAGISEFDRKALYGSIDSLQGIAADLLQKKRDILSGTSKKEVQTLQVSRHLPKIIDFKREQYFENRSILWETEVDSIPFNAFVNLSQLELETVLASLLDNAVESIIDTVGKIKVIASTTNEALVLVVSDTGRGMSQEVLEKIGTENYTVGKPKGNGIGVFHAKQLVEAIGGSVLFSSKVGNGTEVTLTIPLVNAPNGFETNIILKPHQALVLVDDDSLIHDTWRLRLKEFDIEAMHINSVQEFEKWFQEFGKNQLGQFTYIFDFDLRDKNKTGADLIDQYGLNFESVLISGLAEEKSIQQVIERLKVRWLPKELTGLVPINILTEELQGGVLSGAT